MAHRDYILHPPSHQPCAAGLTTGNAGTKLRCFWDHMHLGLQEQELKNHVTWQATSYQTLRDALENHRQALTNHQQALTTARARVQALTTVLHEAEASFSAVEAASAQVQQALDDTLACTEPAALQVDEPEPDTKRPRETVVTSQHAAGASSEAVPEESSGPPSLTPSGFSSRYILSLIHI